MHRILAACSVNAMARRPASTGAGGPSWRGRDFLERRGKQPVSPAVADPEPSRHRRLGGDVPVLHAGTSGGRPEVLVLQLHAFPLADTGGRLEHARTTVLLD